MARSSIAAVTLAAVFAAGGVTLHRSEPSEEAEAMRALRAIAAAQQAYAAAMGGYASSLEALAGVCPPAHIGFIAPDLSRDPSRAGAYEIRVRASVAAAARDVDCNGRAIARGYYATAVPLDRHPRGERAFAVDENRILWSDVTGVAPIPPFHPTATVTALGPLR
jgi:hypothetical protein